MDRDHSKIARQQAPWLTAPSARAVFNVIGGAGHQIFFVGGCVRNALLDASVSDVDLATSATPAEVMALTEAAGMKPVPTGIEHGTITVVADGTPYEVTTFRRDVETDGRHAVVAFSTEVADDARRRDFTMNALYADAQGNITDPLGGMADLRARRVRFIEDAGTRIREDYLRTLRYFRFHAWYGDASEGMDPEALAAIADHLGGLETLSAERVGNEMRKILSASDPSTALASMSQTGVLGTVLPGADVRFALVMIHVAETAGIAPDWMGRLVALGGETATERLRLSKKEQRRYEAIRVAAFEDINLLETAYVHGAAIAHQAYLIRCAIAESPPDMNYILNIVRAATQVFPVSAQDLMPAYTGPALGARLSQLSAAWIASDFTLGKADLLALPAH